MRAWVRLAAAAASLGLAGCLAAAPGEVRVAAPFDPAEAAYVLKDGRGHIDGQAFLRRDGGRLVTAAGERVFLVPATRYATERFDRMFGGERRSYFGNDVEAPPDDYYRFRRETKVDMGGRFAFANLAPGRYIVATRVFWTESRSFFARGGAMYDVVDVKDDAVTLAIISGK